MFHHVATSSSFLFLSCHNTKLMLGLGLCTRTTWSWLVWLNIFILVARNMAETVQRSSWKHPILSPQKHWRCPGPGISGKVTINQMYQTHVVERKYKEAEHGITQVKNLKVVRCIVQILTKRFSFSMQMNFGPKYCFSVSFDF